MADDRMLLRCKGCGNTMVLGKMYCDDANWFFTLPFEYKGKELYDFLGKHSHCCSDTHPFELVYESDAFSLN